MTADDDDGLSFDPKTWGRSAAVPGAPAKAADATVFDPQSAAAPQRRRRGSLIVAVAALVALGVGATVMRSRDDAPAPAVQPESAPDAAAEAPETGPTMTRQTLALAGAGDIAAALLANGVPDADARAAAAAATAALKGGGEIRAAFTIDTAGGASRLVRLEASYPDSSGAVVSRAEDGTFTASSVSAKLSTQIRVVRGEMDAQSFYSSAVAAGVTDSLIDDFARAFAFDFDFQREVRPGDVFEAAFEQAVNAEGKAVGPPRLLFASLTTPQKSRTLYRFQPPTGEAGWFDGNGRSVVRSLMRTPVDGARISSQFGFRVHPILGYQKLHKGTDFAAPTGTPIYASGNAVVDFAGPKGANGNFVRLRHDGNNWQTLYLHMNRFAAGIVAGAHVAQGQQIGEVGTTGRSTGPHLHYEVHIGGEPVNPLGIKTESGQTLAGAALASFIRERDRIDVSRAAEGG